MSDLPSPSRFAKTTRIALGCGVAGALLLSLQSASPLEGYPHAPSWFNWICTVALLTGLVILCKKGAPDERWISGACLIATIHFLANTHPWTIESGAELASVTSRVLSTTWHGVALVALVDGWALVGFGFLAARTVLALYADSTALPPRIAAWLVGLTITLFGLRGLIGYASGSVSLLTP